MMKLSTIGGRIRALAVRAGCRAEEAQARNKGAKRISEVRQGGDSGGEQKRRSR